MNPILDIFYCDTTSFRDTPGHVSRHMRKHRHRFAENEEHANRHPMVIAIGSAFISGLRYYRTGFINTYFFFFF